MELVVRKIVSVKWPTGHRGYPQNSSYSADAAAPASSPVNIASP
jgi:hypothetical protein